MLFNMYFDRQEIATVRKTQDQDIFGDLLKWKEEATLPPTSNGFSIFVQYDEDRKPKKVAKKRVELEDEIIIPEEVSSDDSYRSLTPSERLIVEMDMLNENIEEIIEEKTGKKDKKKQGNMITLAFTSPKR